MFSTGSAHVPARLVTSLIATIIGARDWSGLFCGVMTISLPASPAMTLGPAVGRSPVNLAPPTGWNLGMVPPSDIFSIISFWASSLP